MKSLGALALCLISIEALAGAEGHGGRVWECQPKLAEGPVTHKLIDLDRGEQRWHLTPSFPIGDTADEIALKAVARLDKIDSCRARTLSERIRTFEARVNNLTGHDLPDPGDTYDMTKPEGCTPRTVVNQDPKVQRYSLDITMPGIRFDRDPELWAALDLETQAGIKVHEAIYEEVLGIGKNEADPAIYLTAILLSSKMETLSTVEWERYVTEAGLGICRDGILVGAQPGSAGWWSEANPNVGEPRYLCTKLGADLDWNDYRFVRESQFCVYEDTKSVAVGYVSGHSWKSREGALTLRDRLEFYPVSGALRKAQRVDGNLKIQGESRMIVGGTAQFSTEGRIAAIQSKSYLTLDGQVTGTEAVEYYPEANPVQGLMPKRAEINQTVMVKGTQEKKPSRPLYFNQNQPVLINREGKIVRANVLPARGKSPSGEKLKGDYLVEVVRDASGRFLRGVAILGNRQGDADRYIRIVKSDDDSMVGFRLCSLVEAECAVLGKREFYPADRIRDELRLDGVKSYLKPWVTVLAGTGMVVGGIGLGVLGNLPFAAGMSSAAAVLAFVAGDAGFVAAGTTGIWTIAGLVIEFNTTPKTQKRAIRRLTKRDSFWIWADAPIADVVKSLSTQLAIIDELI
ncbi:MAG: hypothetical protein AAB425_06345 [Bdellovibrionota bacterium]